MKAALVCESIGDSEYQSIRKLGSFPPPCWVAEILGCAGLYKWKRKFIRGSKDYSKANSNGSRGVYITFILESGKIYEVKNRISWGKTDRYFCIVDNDGEVMRITEDEVYECLENAI